MNELSPHSEARDMELVPTTTGARAVAASGPPKYRKDNIMKNNYSIAERNRIVEEYLYCIDRVIRRNSPLMRAAHLDYDDVYQDLAIRLIRCVSGFDPEKGELKQHIMVQLQYEMLNCKDSRRRYGFTAAPRDLRGAVISLDDFRDDDSLLAVA